MAEIYELMRVLGGAKCASRRDPECSAIAPVRSAAAVGGATAEEATRYRLTAGSARFCHRPAGQGASCPSGMQLQANVCKIFVFTAPPAQPVTVPVAQW